MITVATIGHRFADASIEAEALRALGINVACLGALPKDVALAAARDADGILLGLQFALDAEALGRLGRCRVIVRYGIGTDNVDVAEAARLKMVVCNVPDYCIEEVANHTIALLLAIARRLDFWAANVRAGQWASALASVHLPRLSETTLGVVGAGQIGRAVITRAQPIWHRILVCDPWVDAAAVRRLGAEPTALDGLLAASDFITLHLPSTPETRHLLSDRRLRVVKRGAVLVNCSRGDIIDEPALVVALQDGRIVAAGLDVFADEPPPQDGLIGMPQVYPTPHVAFLSDPSIRELRRRAAEEAGRVLLGEVPRHAVANPG